MCSVEINHVCEGWWCVVYHCVCVMCVCVRACVRACVCLCDAHPTAGAVNCLPKSSLLGMGELTDVASVIVSFRIEVMRTSKGKTAKKT